MKIHSLFLLLMMFFLGFASIAKAEVVTCELGVQTPSNRRINDLLLKNSVNLELQQTAEMQTEIMAGDDLKGLKVMGNIHLDPVTKKKKLFVGIYLVSGLERNKQPGSFLLMHNLTDKVSVDDGVPLYEYLTPIVSGISDSGSVQLLAEDFGGGPASKLRLDCGLSNVAQFVSSLIPEHKTERFSCNVFVGHVSSNRAVEEKNKTVILGHNSSTFMRDLQPIIEDKHFDGYFSNVRLMANLFKDQKTKQTKFLLGIYRMWRYYDAEKHSDYWTTDRSKGPKGKDYRFSFAQPEAEIITSSDYAELTTAVAFEGFNVKLDCKKQDNKNKWAEDYTF